MARGKNVAHSQGSTDAQKNADPKIGTQYQLKEYSQHQKDNWKSSKRIVLYEGIAQFKNFIVRIGESPSGNSKNGLPMGLENQQVRDYAGPEGLSEGGTPSTTSAEPTPLINNSIPKTEIGVNPGDSTNAATAATAVTDVSIDAEKVEVLKYDNQQRSSALHLNHSKPSHKKPMPIKNTTQRVGYVAE